MTSSPPELQAPAREEIRPAEAAATGAESGVVQATVAAEELATEPVAAAPPPASTLLEFPGVSRNKPQWRKELSERVREIQERRAREAESENALAAHQTAEPLTSHTQLGLVPQPDAPIVNPLVAKALKRIERAHQPPPMPRTRAGGAATAVARVAEEQYQPAEHPELELGALVLPAPEAEPLPEAKPVEAARERTLVVVPTALPVKTVEVSPEVEARPASKPVSQKVFVEKVLGDLEVIDEAPPETISATESYDDRAPMVARLVASVIDLLVVVFASSPFAAIIELTNGDWSNVRLVAVMCGIVVTMMFMYLAASTALAGRTWGMSLLSIRAADAGSGLPPTTKQSVVRALLYMLSLPLFGLGIFYALFDAEGRTAHDHFSGTVVVRE